MLAILRRHDFLCPSPQIARKVVSVTSQVTKEAIKYAPVDGRIKNGIAAGADMIKAQADADPNAGVGERLALGVGEAGVYVIVWGGGGGGK